MRQKRAVLSIVLGLLVSLSSFLPLLAVVASWDVSNDWDISSDWDIAGFADNPPYEDTPPSVSDSIAGFPATFSIQWGDDYGLSYGYWESNNSGTWSNHGLKALSGVIDVFEDTITLNSTIGVVVSYRLFANDSRDQWTQTGVSSFTTTAPFASWGGTRGIVIAPRVTFNPNPFGLNTDYAFANYAVVDNVSFPYESLQIPVNGSIYSINVTDKSDVDVTISNWFDSYGTVFTVSIPCHVSLNVSGLGEPSLINGWLSKGYHDANKTLELDVKAGSINIHWESGGYSTLDQNPALYHSTGELNSVYGFAIPQNAWMFFYARVYCKTGHEELINVTVSFNDGSAILFDPSASSDSLKIRRLLDPTGFLEVKRSGYFLLWEHSINTYLIRWKIKYENYSSPQLLQNTTTTVRSSEVGTISNQEYGTYFVYLQDYDQSFIDAWINVAFWLLGLFFIIATPIWGTLLIRTKGVYESSEKLGLLFVLFIVGCGLIIIGLWN